MTPVGQEKSPLRHRRVLLAVLTSLIACGIGVLAFEVALRFTEYRYLLSPTQFPDGYFRKDQELGIDHASNSPSASFTMRGPGFEVFTNSLGCFDRDDEIEAGYVLAVGDSATWGFVPAEKSWTNVLQSLTGRQVLNCGVTGIGTHFAMLKAKRVMDQVGFPPSLIILLYVDNDLNDDFVFPSYTVLFGQRLDKVKTINMRTGELTRYSEQELNEAYHSYRSNEVSLKQKLKNNSLTAWLIYRLVVEPLVGDSDFDNLIMNYRYAVHFWDLQDEKYPWLSTVVEKHLQNFRDFHQLANRYGTQLIIFDVGVEGPVARPHRLRFFQRLRDELEFVFPVTFDTLEQADTQQIHHRFDDHWSEFGNKRAAEEMSNRLRKAELL